LPTTPCGIAVLTIETSLAVWPSEVRNLGIAGLRTCYLARQRNPVSTVAAEFIYTF
jgi:hypothetical protein